MLQKKYYKMVRVSYADSDLFRITNVSDQPGTLTISNGGGTLKYSLNGVDFTTYDFTTHPTITVPAGANLYMKGAKESTTYNWMKFNMNVNHTAGGNIMSIIDETNYATMTTAPNFAFQQIFSGDTHLISAGDLNFGQVSSFSGQNSMYEMFRGCSNLVTPPDTSSITSVVHQTMTSMFYGCKSLTQPCDLSNITSIGNSGMGSMFYGCTALTAGADLSSVTSVESNGLKETYRNCTALTTAYAPNVSTWANTSNWLQSVAASGTLYCPNQTVADLIPTSSTSGCPTGWTKVVM